MDMKKKRASFHLVRKSQGTPQGTFNILWYSKIFSLSKMSQVVQRPTFKRLNLAPNELVTQSGCLTKINLQPLAYQHQHPSFWQLLKFLRKTYDTIRYSCLAITWKSYDLVILICLLCCPHSLPPVLPPG